MLLFQHPGYDHGYTAELGAYPNDIALLQLEPNSVISEKHYIPLATEGDFAGDNCAITGWGRLGGYTLSHEYPYVLEDWKHEGQTITT